MFEVEVDSAQELAAQPFIEAHFSVQHLMAKFYQLCFP